MARLWSLSKKYINASMENAIISSKNGVTLIGGGEVGERDIELALSLAPLLVAADGGASHALAAGYVPTAVIGDFDSLAPADRAQLPENRLFRIREQDSTDFDKALRHVSAPLILSVGFLGARVDHQLAAFNTLARNAEKPCILIGKTEIVFHVPSRLSLDLDPGDIVSLFPLSRVTGRSTGLQWPIDGLPLAPDGRVGTSNRAKGPVQIDMDGPGLLAIVPRRALRQAVRAISLRDSAPGGH